MNRTLPLMVCLGLLVGAVVGAETLKNDKVIQLHKIGLVLVHYTINSL